MSNNTHTQYIKITGNLVKGDDQTPDNNKDVIPSNGEYTFLYYYLQSNTKLSSFIGYGATYKQLFCE